MDSFTADADKARNNGLYWAEELTVNEATWRESRAGGESSPFSGDDIAYGIGTMKKMKERHDKACKASRQDYS